MSEAQTPATNLGLPVRLGAIATLMAEATLR
jgi:hypothetical protein